MSEERPLGRSIPACTGEPRIVREAEDAARVYPRVYGGTSVLAVAEEAGQGLSPRVRGNLY